MLKYEKLPPKTPMTVTAGILAIGACLGFSIAIMAFISLYGFTGLLANFFYPKSNLVFTDSAGLYLGLIAFLAGITVVALSFLAFYMNILSKKAIVLSRRVFAPLTVMSCIVLWQHTSSIFSYHLGINWVIASFSTVILAGLLPALLLNNKQVKKIHNR